MVYEDLEYMKTLPNYQKYLNGGAEVKKIRSIYPTVTYPAHASMASGSYPASHGVISNTVFDPGNIESDWYWFHKTMEGRDIFDVAKQKGLVTASIFWPVTAGHPSIDYLIPAYWTQNPDETVFDAHRRAGVNETMIRIMESHKEGWKEKQPPEFDQFKISCACDVLKKFKPDVLFVHPTNIDDYRHKYGVFNDKVNQGVRETDEWIGQIMRTLEETGALEETNFFLVSDHGQIDTKRIINVNVLLADAGLIRVDENGGIASWDAYCHSNGMSSLVYLRNSGDCKLLGKVGNLLNHLCEEGIYGIGRVFTRQEVLETEHLNGDFSFVLDSDGYTAFREGWMRPLLKNFEFNDYRYGRATHGYYPDKGPQPFLLAKGPAIRDGVVLEERPIVDEAPTYARIMRIELPEAEGKCIEDILK